MAGLRSHLQNQWHLNHLLPGPGSTTHLWPPQLQAATGPHRPMPSLCFDTTSTHNAPSPLVGAPGERVVGNIGPTPQMRMVYESSFGLCATRPAVNTVGDVVELFFFGQNGHFPLLHLKKKLAGTSFLVTPPNKVVIKSPCRLYTPVPQHLRNIHL